jgi:hypothetical protein
LPHPKLFLHSDWSASTSTGFQSLWLAAEGTPAFRPAAAVVLHRLYVDGARTERTLLLLLWYAHVLAAQIPRAHPPIRSVARVAGEMTPSCERLPSSGLA